MRARQAAAVVASVAIVLAAYATWQAATGRFNPYPRAVSLDTSSCDESAPPCPAFKILSANLTVRTFQDIRSQELSIGLLALGPTGMDTVSVYFSGIPIGNFTGVVRPGSSITLAWAVPTTVAVGPGKEYSVLVCGQYDRPGTQQAEASFWSSTTVVAS